MKVYSFPRGGLSYEDSSAPVKGTVENAFLPIIAIIPLSDSVKKAYPAVSIGEFVKEGMLIGRGAGSNDVNVHSSIPGRVSKKVTWKDREGFNNEALMIVMEGSFERLGKKEDNMIWEGVSGYDLQKIISDYGIVEMEKNGRSLSEMISSARRENDKLTLVVRCVFDDPWLAADHALCIDRMKDLIEGAAIVAKACLKTEHIIFAVSYKERELGQLLIREAGRLEYPVSLVLTGSRYPQRSQRELELALRKYERKEEANFGKFLILGPAVLCAVSDAVVHRKPIMDRYVAVGGSAVKTPKILKVRVGTRIKEVIDQCGGFTEPPQRIVVGSPLSGREITYLDEPVTKTCYAIAALTKSQSSFHKPQNCINCGECRSVCPVGLDPQNIYKRIRAKEIDNASTAGCQGCGCCRIVCPSSLPLLETIMETKQEEFND